MVPIVEKINTVLEEWHNTISLAYTPHPYLAAVNVIQTYGNSAPFWWDQ